MSSGPSVPNATQVSNDQTASNIKSATAQQNLNMVNQVTPFGNQTHTQIGTNPDGTPKYQSTTTLSPQLQNLLNTQLSNANTAASGITTPNYQTVGSNDYSADRQRVEDAMFGRLNSQIDRDRASMEQNLANKGIQVGAEAYRNSADDFNRGVSDARTSVLLAGGQEQPRLSDLERANTAANNQISNQSLQDRLAIMSGQSVGMPQFNSTPTAGVAPTDVAGNAWQQYGAQKQQNDSFWNGLGAIGGALGGWAFSDERLKTDKERGGETEGGTPIYSYRYKGSPMMQMGVMAQDVKKKQPEAVKKTPSGFLAVNYREVK